MIEMTCSQVEQTIAAEVSGWFAQLERDGVTTLEAAKDERIWLISDIAFQLINGTPDPIMMVHDCQRQAGETHVVKAKLTDYMEGSA